MIKSIIILFILLWVTPAYAAIDNISSCDLRNITSISSTEVGLFIDNELYDKGGTVVKYYNSSFTDLKPSYQIISLVDKNVIDAGDEFVIFIQIVGQGIVKSNLFYVAFPPQFLNPKYRGYTEYYIIDAANNKAFWFNERPCKIGFDPQGYMTVLPKAIFGEFVPNSPGIWGERVYQDHSPIVLNVRTDPNAPPGDRLIKFSLLYSDGKEWYHTQEETSIHIRDWYEKWLNQILITALLPIIGFLYTKRREILKTLQRLRHKIPTYAGEY